VTYARIELDGEPPTADRIAAAALVNYGHYSTMQIRGRAVRGLDLHLTRLDAATRELFDTELDPERVRDLLRHALGDVPDATGRITVVDGSGGAGAAPSVIVALTEPAEVLDRPARLRSVRYQRPFPYLKHAGSFGQIYHGRRAERAGYDDALLVDDAGVIAETAVANIAFVDGDEVVWPDAPALAGITMQLLEPRLPSRRRAVRLSDVTSFDGAFITNSRGVTPVGQVDDVRVPVDDRVVSRVVEAYAAVPWDPI
jgi:branched-subunit amino acid aminotransferase/4-amino-4-deoxychorismate lyase